MTNRQVREVEMNLLEFLLISGRDNPAVFYDYVTEVFKSRKEMQDANHAFLDEECQLTYSYTR